MMMQTSDGGYDDPTESFHSYVFYVDLDTGATTIEPAEERERTERHTVSFGHALEVLGVKGCDQATPSNLVACMMSDSSGWLKIQGNVIYGTSIKRGTTEECNAFYVSPGCTIYTGENFQFDRKGNGDVIVNSVHESITVKMRNSYGEAEIIPLASSEITFHGPFKALGPRAVEAVGTYFEEKIKPERAAAAVLRSEMDARIAGFA